MRIRATTFPPGGSTGPRDEPVRPVTFSLERCVTSKTPNGSADGPSGFVVGLIPILTYTTCVD
jgi:hypothetical protein